MVSESELVKMFGEPIYRYAREQNIKDGGLVDVSAWASDREMRGGFNVSTCMTGSLWGKVEAPKGSDQDTRGRAHDVLFMAGIAARAKPERFFNGYEIPFSVKIGNRRYCLWVKLDGDGVTIGFPEDF